MLIDLQGCINGHITQLAGDPDKLKAYMSDKTEEQKRQGRIHLKTVKYLRDKK